MNQLVSKSSWKILFISQLLNLFFQVTTAAYPPFQVMAFNVTVKSFSITWQSFDRSVSQFLATISPLNDGESTETMQHVTESRANWNGLIAGKTYSVNVISEDIDGSLSLPTSINVTTVPEAPSSVRVSKFVNPIMNQYQTDTNRTMMYAVYGAVVMWEGPDVGRYDGYKVTVSPPDGMVRLPIELSNGEPVSQVRKRRRIIWDLIPGVYYEFSVRTTSNSRRSEAVVAGERMPPEIPCPIKVVAISPTSVTLSWKHRPHRGVIDGFIVEIDPEEGTEIEPKNPEEKGRFITDLTPGTVYKIDVYSTSFGILSFQPRSIEIKTPPYPPVGPVYVSNITFSTLTIEWQWPVGNVDYFEVVYFPRDRDFGRLRHRIFNPAVLLTSLTPNTEYSLIFYSVSNGVYSKPLHAIVWTKSVNATDAPVESGGVESTPSASQNVQEKIPSDATSEWRKVNSTEISWTNGPIETSSENVKSTIFHTSKEAATVQLTSASTPTTTSSASVEKSFFTQPPQVTTIDEFDIVSKLTSATDFSKVQIKEVAPTSVVSAQLLIYNQTKGASKSVSSTATTAKNPSTNVKLSTSTSRSTTDGITKGSFASSFPFEPSKTVMSSLEIVTDPPVLKSSPSTSMSTPFYKTEGGVATSGTKTTKATNMKTSALLLYVISTSKSATTTAKALSTASPTSTSPVVSEYNATGTVATFISTSSPSQDLKRPGDTASSMLTTSAKRLVTTIASTDGKLDEKVSTIEPAKQFPVWPENTPSTTSVKASATTMPMSRTSTQRTITDTNQFDETTTKTVPTSTIQFTTKEETPQTSTKDLFGATTSSVKSSYLQASSTENLSKPRKTLATSSPKFTEISATSKKETSTSSPRTNKLDNSTVIHDWKKSVTTSATFANKVPTTLGMKIKNTTYSNAIYKTKIPSFTQYPIYSLEPTSVSSLESFTPEEASVTSPKVFDPIELIVSTSQLMPTAVTLAQTSDNQTKTMSTTVTDEKHSTAIEPKIKTEEQVLLETSSGTTISNLQSGRPSSVVIPTIQSSGFEALPNTDITTLAIDPTDVPLVTSSTESIMTSTKRNAFGASSVVAKGATEPTTTSRRITRPVIERPMHIKEGFTTICKPNNITILVDKELIGKYEERHGPLYLNDQKDEKCRGIEHPTYYRYTIAPNILDCGTRIELNETHVNFTNTISNSINETHLLRAVENLNSEIIVGGQRINHVAQFLHVRIWCTFPLDMNVSTLFPFLPQLTLQYLTFNVSGIGEFSAVMQLYKTEEYKEAYLSPPHINITDMLYVGINLLEIENNSTFMIVERCWGTPVRSPDYPGGYPIIENGCPLKESLDGSVRILENGNGTRVRWEGYVFKFLDYDEVWLHCAIQVCFGDDCKQTCNSSRKRRSVEVGSNFANLHIISTGPIVMAKRKISQEDQSALSTQSSTTSEPSSMLLEHTSLLVIVAVLSVIIVISCIVIVIAAICFRRQRPQKDLSTKIPSSNILSNLSISDEYANDSFKTDEDILLDSSVWTMEPNIWTLERNPRQADNRAGPSHICYRNSEQAFWQDNRGICLKPNRHGPTMTSFKAQNKNFNLPSNSKSNSTLHTDKNPLSVLTPDGVTGQFTQVV